MVRKKALPIGKQGFAFKERKTRRGFTLIEILIVVGVFSILALTASMTFFNLLKSSTKSRTVTMVKQNGDYAMGVMTRMIRNARKVTSACPGNAEEITIMNPDGESTTFSCGGGSISSASATSANLISNDVEVDSGTCNFNCQEGRMFEPDAVTIEFTLSRTGSRPEGETSVNFETMVSLRNIDD